MRLYALYLQGVIKHSDSLTKKVIIGTFFAITTKEKAFFGGSAKCKKVDSFLLCGGSAMWAASSRSCSFLEGVVAMSKKVVVLAAVVMLLPTVAMAFHPGRCEPCHIPHMAFEDPAGEIPLWSGAKTAVEVFENYDSPTMQGDTGDPEGSTLLCLACHDGTEDNSRHTIVPEGGAAGDLSGTHPMEFPFTTALAEDDGELSDPNEAGSSPVNPEHTIAQDMLQAVTGDMKCYSCHEIHANGLHDTTVTTPGGTEYDFDVPHLVNIPGIEFKAGYGQNKELEESYGLRYEALCTTCHEK